MSQPAALPKSPAGKQERRDHLSAILLLLQSGPIVILVALVAIFGAIAQNFLSIHNVQNLLAQSAIVCALGLGEFLVILVRGVDVSVGSTLALSVVVVATLTGVDAPSSVAQLALYPLVGLAVGLLNGTLIVKGGIPQPLVVTVATLGIASGVALLISGGNTLVGVSPAVDWLANGKILGIPANAFLVILLCGLFWVLLRRTQWGRWLYAVGGNPDVAQWVYDRQQAAGRGTDTLPASDAYYLPLRAPMRTRGVLVVAAQPNADGALGSPEQHRLLDTFAAQIALAAPSKDRFHPAQLASLSGQDGPAASRFGARVPEIERSSRLALALAGSGTLHVNYPIQTASLEPAMPLLAPEMSDGPVDVASAPDFEAVPESAPLPARRPKLETSQPAAIAEAAPPRQTRTKPARQQAGEQQALAYAAPGDGAPSIGQAFKNLFSSAPNAGNGVAVYDISAQTVTMPDGQVPEAHSASATWPTTPATPTRR